MTRKEKDYLRDVAQLSCIACRINGKETIPVEVHHQLEGMGMGHRASHFDTMPLCPLHHRFSTKDSVHQAPEEFKRLYGMESELVKLTHQDVENYRKTFVGYVEGTNEKATRLFIDRCGPSPKGGLRVYGRQLLQSLPARQALVLA